MVRSDARSANLANLRKVLLQEVLEVSWANVTRRNVVVMPLPAKTEYARMHL